MCLQLETTAERIRAVDHAAAMVDEMLKQPNANNGVKVSLILSDFSSYMIHIPLTNFMITVPG